MTTATAFSAGRKLWIFPRLYIAVSLRRPSAVPASATQAKLWAGLRQEFADAFNSVWAVDQVWASAFGALPWPDRHTGVCSSTCWTIPVSLTYLSPFEYPMPKPLTRTQLEGLVSKEGLWSTSEVVSDLLKWMKNERTFSISWFDGNNPAWKFLVIREQASSTDKGPHVDFQENTSGTVTKKKYRSSNTYWEGKWVSSECCCMIAYHILQI